jgi:hypothetical protein
MDYFNGLVSILTLIVAYNALKVWKIQLRGTDKHNLLKNLMKATYIVEEQIKLVRSPMIPMSQKGVEDSSYLEVEMKIYNNRYNELVKEFLNLKSLMFELKFYWGKEKINQLFNPLESVIGEIRGAIWLHFWMKGAYNPMGVATIDKSQKQSNDKIIYDVSPKDKLDDFSQKVNDIVKNVEKFIDAEVIPPQTKTSQK